MKMFDRKFASFFNKRQKNINNFYLYKRTKWFSYSFILLIILLVIVGFKILNDDISEFFINMPNLGERIKEMLGWDFEAWTKPTSGIYGDPFFKIAFNTIWDTFILSLSGTIIGISLGIPFAILCANNIVSNKYINCFCKFLLNLLRTIPSFVYSLIFIGIFGKSGLTVMIAVSIFTFSMSSKMLFDKIEQINIYPYEALTSIGTSKFKAFRSAIVPQMKPHILSVAFYSLEVNLKYISIIALVTKKGFGEMVEFYRGTAQWNKIGFLLFLLILTILMLEFLICILKKYIFIINDVFLNDKKNKKILNDSKKKLKKSNINFYIDYVVLKNWNIDFKALKRLKDTTQKTYKLEKYKLLKQKKILINNFKDFHKNKIYEDKIKFNNIKNEYVNQPKKWFFENEYQILTRYDRAYLTKFNYDVNLLKRQLEINTKKIIEEENKKFINSLTINKVAKYKSYDYIKKLFIATIFLSLFIYSLVIIDVDMQNEKTIQTVGKGLKSIFNIKWKSILFITDSVAYSVVYLLFETLLIALIGTLIGFCFAFIFATLGSKNIVNKYVALFFATISTIIRPIPTYIYALTFVIIVGLGPVNGILAIAMGTTGMLSKYIREFYNSINQKLLESINAIGLNGYQKFKYVILPNSSSEMIAWLIYRFEINYKEVIMLSIVGAGNMGFILKSYFNSGYYGEFGALLFGIIITSSFIEYVASTFKQKIRYDKEPKLINKICLKIKQKRIWKYKLNAKYLNINYSNMDYDQLKALWINTNIDIVQNKKNFNGKYSYYWAYCKKYNLKLDDCKKNALSFEKNFYLNRRKHKNLKNT